MADTREIALSVPDVSCEHCVHTVNGTLSPYSDTAGM
jgi:copper chaperone CopZ